MKHLINFIKAIIIGFISCAVPGISSLTFAVVLCIYFPLVEALSGIAKNFKKNILFIIIFFLGYAIGAVLGANVVATLFNKYPLIIICIIFGLILGSMPKMIKDILPYAKKPSCWLIFIIVAAIFTTFQLTTKVTKTVDLSQMDLKMYVIVALVGFLASISFAFPGFDYKILLLAVGFYYPVMNAIKNLSNNVAFLENLIFIACYLLGYIVGMFLFSNLIKTLSKRFPGQIKFAALALIVTSPYMIVEVCITKNSSFVYESHYMVIGSILFAVSLLLMLLADLFNNPERGKEEVMNNRNVFKLYISSIFGLIKRHRYLRAIKKRIKDNTISFSEKFAFCTKILDQFNKRARIEPIVKGLENLNDEVTLYVVNHQGKYDAIGILSALKRHPASFVIGQEYFNYPYSKEILKLIESIPDNEQKEEKIINALNNNRSVIIFIQKGRIEANTVRYFKTSILELAYLAKVKITPVLLYDSYLVYHKEKREIKNPQIAFLKPIQYDDFKDLDRTKLSSLIRNEMAEEIIAMNKIKEE